MKKFIVCVIFCLAMGVSAFAGSKFPELEKIRQVKLLESTREDVRRIFAEYVDEEEEESLDENSASDEFSTKDIRITFRYSLGNCSDDDDEGWNVAKGKVTEIGVLLRKSIKAKDLKIDLAKLERISIDDDDEEDEEPEPDDFIYYDKASGVSYGLDDGEIKNIKYTPTEENLTALCNNETVREHITNKDWLRANLKERPHRTIVEGFISVSEVTLSKNEIIVDCRTEAADDEASSENMKIGVKSKSVSSDPTDIPTFNYTVSGGTIVGTGADVTWDLTGVAPGKYTITAGVDNGCGVCGTTVTKTVVVKESENCNRQKK